MATHRKNKFIWVLSLLMASLLFAGLVVALVNLQYKNTVRSNAETTSTQLINCSVEPAKTAISTDEQNLFTQINVYRQMHGLNALAWSEDLTRGASWMSENMLETGNLSHTDSLGRDVPTRLVNCGYINYATVAENIDSGTSDSEAIFNAWKHSPAHSANLLNQGVKEIGVALSSDDSTQSYYWVLNLGSRIIVTPTDSIPTPTTPNVPTPTPIRTPTPTRKPTPTTPQVPSQTPTPTPITVYPTSIPTDIPTPTLRLTPTPPADYVANPLDMQLFISAKVTGIGADGNKNPIHQTRHVDVEIYDKDNKLVTIGNGFIIYDGLDLFRGIIHFGPVKNGTYYVKIIGDYMLQIIVQPLFQALDSNRLNILPDTVLLQGDLNEDNVIDIKDYNLALGCFQKKRCDDAALIDFNKDGTSDIVDYNILLHNYWESLGD